MLLKGLDTFVTLCKLAVNASKTNCMVFTMTGEPQELPSDINHNGVYLLLKNVLPIKVLMSLYHNLIASYINYGCLIWASNFQSNYRRVQV